MAGSHEVNLCHVLSVAFVVHLLTVRSRGAFTPYNTIGSGEPPSFSQRTPDSAAESAGLSNIGDSSSLFSYRTPPAFDFAVSANTHPDSETSSPIPFVFGASGPDKKQRTRIKMVNERSPAKPALNPVAPNDQPPRVAGPAYPSKPQPTTVPQFGQPTLPQSPLRRPAPKESTAFIQPKSRPEHHRDGAGECVFEC